MSHKSQRLSWRARCRRWQCYINALLAALALALVVASTPALAAPRCPGGTATANGCSYELPTMTCAWPLRLPGVGNVAYCYRPGAEVQP